MTAIRGVYENGQIKLLEDVDYKTSQKVIVMFLDDKPEDDDLRTLSLSQPAGFLKEYLHDKREDLYQDYAKTPGQ